jgi:Domain of unknown function (DUF4783)
MKRIFTLLIITVIFSSFQYAQPPLGINEVAAALKSGNASQVAKHFDNTVDLGLPGKSNSGSYSKSQAELVLKDFFASNGIKSFDVIHQGENGGSQFCIGTLITRNGSFRTTVYMKQRGEQQVLQELKFENR